MVECYKDRINKLEGGGAILLLIRVRSPFMECVDAHMQKGCMCCVAHICVIDSAGGAEFVRGSAMRPPSDEHI